ncbi:MAG: hypothetical protein WC365_03415 [Candidatus Babeliales bacterium]|jgi:hypothetical protein
MKKLLKKYIFVFGICAIIQPQLFSTLSGTVEIITACLRAPAAYYEFKLRNDNSSSAYFKRAFIQTIRLFNDVYTSGKDPSFSIVYDIASAAGSLIAGGAALKIEKSTSTDKQLDKTSCLGNDYEKLGLFILPLLEMLCALARTQKISPTHANGFPNGNKLIANIGLDLTRITQFVLINSSGDPKKRNFIVTAFILMCVIAICLEIRDFNHRKHQAEYSSPEAQEKRAKEYQQEQRELDKQAHQRMLEAEKEIYEEIRQRKERGEEIRSPLYESFFGKNGEKLFPPSEQQHQNDPSGALHPQSHLDGCADCHKCVNLRNEKCGHRLCPGCTLKNTLCPICKTVL